MARVDAIRKAIDRYEDYTGHKDFASFNKDQATAFKKHLAKQRRSGAASMAGSTVVATTNALKEFFRWLAPQPGYRDASSPTDASSSISPENERRAVREPRLKTFPTLEQIRAAIAADADGNGDRDARPGAAALAILTGARDSALASLRLKHVDLDRKLVLQDPREVRTKRRKRIDTFLFPLDPVSRRCSSTGSGTCGR